MSVKFSAAAGHIKARGPLIRAITNKTINIKRIHIKNIYNSNGRVCVCMCVDCKYDNTMKTNIPICFYYIWPYSGISRSGERKNYRPLCHSKQVWTFFLSDTYIKYFISRSEEYYTQKYNISSGITVINIVTYSHLCIVCC